MKITTLFLLSTLVTVYNLSTSELIAQDETSEPRTSSTTKVVLASEVEWQQLNPARGDKSPQAATLWGDRKGTVATGFLAKFVDGFASPPHIHNVSYRAVVIAGGIHNDDPNAKPMWMPPGSFWTQPAGEVHITASRGAGIAYVEIESGPYLVLPEDQANDNGERPVNIVPENMVWLDDTSTSWISSDKKGTSDSESNSSDRKAKLAFLWGDFSDEKALTGTMIKLPAGFSGSIQSLGSSFQSITIDGQATFQTKDGEDNKALTPGSYLISSGAAKHEFSTPSGEDHDGCLLYVRSKGRFKIVQN